MVTFGVKFVSRRGDRAVYGGGLENRSLDFRDRGFESHPLRFFEFVEHYAASQSEPLAMIYNASF